MSFDARKCIEMLSDKKQDFDVREAAADSLIWSYPTEEVACLLYSIVMDASEDEEFREEMAICLGSVWGDIGVLESQNKELPEKFRNLAKNEFELRTKTV